MDDTSSLSKRARHLAFKVTSPLATTSLAVAASRVLFIEPMLLQTILGFIPPENAVVTSSSSACCALQTIVTLCRAIPGLSALVGPSNALFWRGLVLDHFDFTVDARIRFNVEECSDYLYICRDEMIAQHCKVSGEDDWNAHPVKPHVDAWEAAHPDHGDPEMYLKHDLLFWSQLGAYFRPAEYAFLRELQCDRKSISSAWPAHEDAFSLFRDLTAIQTLASAGNNYSTFSDGYNEVLPCLLARFDREITRPGYELLEFCDFYPHFWFGNPPVTSTWTGFAATAPCVDWTDADEAEWERLGRSGLTDEERDVFPICTTKRSFLNLRRLVYDRCSDWRRVHVNIEEFPSPEFYIGKSKASYRWIGLVGQSDYDAGRRHEESDERDSE